jgi:hypothetical protein
VITGRKIIVMAVTGRQEGLHGDVTEFLPPSKQLGCSKPRKLRDDWHQEFCNLSAVHCIIIHHPAHNKLTTVEHPTRPSAQSAGTDSYMNGHAGSM